MEKKDTDQAAKHIPENVPGIRRPLKVVLEKLNQNAKNQADCQGYHTLCNIPARQPLSERKKLIRQQCKKENMAWIPESFEMTRRV